MSSWPREELRQLAWHQPAQILDHLEEMARALPPLELPSITVWMEGQRLKADFVSYFEGRGVLLSSLEAEKENVDLVVVPLEKISAITVHYRPNQLRRQLRKNAPATSLLTPLGIRREVEFWLEPWRTGLGLSLSIDIAWSDFLSAAPAQEVLPLLQEGLAGLRMQLESAASSKMGVAGLQGVGSILITPPPDGNFSLTRTGAQVTYSPAVDDGLPIWPSAMDLRRALEKVL